MAEAVFTLAAADIELFYYDEDGEVVDPATYRAGCATDLKLTYRFEERIRRPTGAPYPIVRHIGEEHIIEVSGLWTVDSAEFMMERSVEFMMRITWNEPHNSGKQQVRTYYGVTNISADMASEGVMQMNQTKRFRAKYFVSETV